MKTKTLTKTLSLLLLLVGGIHAQATSTYIVTLTNGSLMPLSPGAFYASHMQAPIAKVGQTPTAGFIRLCQMGDPSERARELSVNKDVTFVTQTMGPIMPGQSVSVEVNVEDPLQQSIQVETMYGKTKDICAVASVNSHSLYALKQHVTSEVVVKDSVLQTGAFLDPALPMGQSYLDANSCQGIMDAASCLRQLALPNMGAKSIRYFSSYLSSVEMFLEKNYGANEVKNLLVPSSGAVQLQIRLKH